MNQNFRVPVVSFLRKTALRRGAIFGSILLVALLAFEVFNFSTTAYALRDVLGDLTFLGMRWAGILAVAFCGIDFAGIARIFTPEQGQNEPAEVWYLFGAWLLAASFNAILTWWGVSVAILNHTPIGGILLGQSAMTKMVPVFVAVMVWLVRVLVIGTFSIAGDRLFTVGETQPYQHLGSSPQPRPEHSYPRPAPRPASTTGNTVPRPAVNRPEPSYHPVGVSARSNDENNSPRR